MSTNSATPPGSATEGAVNPRGGWRTLALATTVIGVVLLTAAACVLSYSGIHTLARQAGASVQMARFYPAMLDAMAVIAGSSVLALRGAGLPSRLYAWLCFLVLLAGLATGSAVHAANLTIPHRPAEYGAAIIPWVLVLLGFGLLLTLLRQARLKRPGRTGEVRVAERAAADGETEPMPSEAAASEPAAYEPGQSEPGQSEPAVSALPVREPGAGWPTVPAPRTAELQLRATFPRRPTGTEPAAEEPSGAVTEPSEDDTAAGLNAAPVPAQSDPAEPEGGGSSVTSQPDAANLDDADISGSGQAGPPAFDRPHSSPQPPVD